MSMMNLVNLVNLIFLLFLMGVLNLCFNRVHLLMVLISFEYLILLIYFQLLIYLSNLITEMYFLMIFLVLSVCEGVLGLSILIKMVRTHGNDYFQTLSLL